MQTCITCTATTTTHYLTYHGYTVLRCTTCGFMFVHPTPSASELAAYYANVYSVPFTRDAGATARHAARLADLERWVPQRGVLLELGASHGFFLAHARAQGWQTYGSELAPAAAAHARTALGLDVFSGDLLAAPYAPASFDAAVAWHVLEHTLNPSTQLERLHVLLRPGGVLGLRVPNIGGRGARLAGRAWPWLCPPAHLWYWDAQTLPRLLARLGYCVIDVCTVRGDGNNLYQHALVASGLRLVDGVRSVARRAGQPFATRQRTKAAQAPVLAATPPAPLRRSVQLWLALLRRIQPVTDALARWTPALADAQDELVVYARRTE